MAIKKKRIEDFSNELTLMSEIEEELIYKLEICVENGFIMQDDCKTVVKLDGKPICFPKNLYDNFNIVKFDPFFNKKITYMLFERFIAIFKREHPDVYIHSYFSALDATDMTRPMAVLKTSNGDYTSNKFSNETVSWIDLLFRLDGENRYKELSFIDNGIVGIRKIEV
jgi:hypothetical protein